VVRFVASLLATFPTEVALHQHQGCGRSLTRCDAHGLCAELLPELIEIDDWGYPVLADGDVPRRLSEYAEHAVRACPQLALLARSPKV